MCFSATASFVAAGGLSAAGILALKKSDKKTRLIALIPLLFGIQQFFEGLQWLVPHPSSESLILGYGFLFFAFLLWPTYFPLSLYVIEKNEKRKKILLGVLIAGILTTLNLLIVILTNPMNIEALSCGILYDVNISLSNAGLLIYVAVVNIGPLISTHKPMRSFGIILAISALISYLFFAKTFISTWCFFAAVLSIFIYIHISAHHKKKKRSKK